MQLEPPPTSSPPPPPASAVGVLSKRKGVRYDGDGRVLSCRFCEILRRRNERFEYEDERVAVFRPLRPIAASHILIVPRAHIRNVHLLASGHEALLRHMRRVAERVLRGQVGSAAPEEEEDDADDDARDVRAATSSKVSDESSKGTDEDEDPCAVAPHHLTREKAAAAVTTRSQPQVSHAGGGVAGVDDVDAASLKFAFHVPPFNSIDHVHMHAFRDEPRERVGVFGRVKYRTESWWCRSYDAVLERVRSAKHLGSSSSSNSSHASNPSASSSSSSRRSVTSATLSAAPAAVCS